MKTPEEVVAAAFAAINMEDWHGLTELCDPLSLDVFKKQTIDFLVDLADGYGLAADDPEFDPMERIRYNADPTFFLRYELTGVSSIDEVREMGPARVFVRWLQARSPSRWSESAGEDPEYEPGGDDADSNTGRRTIRSYRYTVLGSVPDGPDIAYVLFRPTDTVCEIYPEAYQQCLQRWSEAERRFMAAVHNRGDPCLVICRRSNRSWHIVAKRNFFLMDSLDVVEVHRGDRS